MRTFFLALLISAPPLFATVCPPRVAAEPHVRKLRKWAGQAKPLGTPVAQHRQDLPVLIIGAGPAGLAMMRELQDAGIPWEAVERWIEVGGVWAADNPESPAYPGLRSNSSYGTTHLGDPLPDEYPDFPSAPQLHAYLKDFAVRHGLRRGIEFNHSVESLEKQSDGSWCATLRPGRALHRIHKCYRAVVVASGSNSRSSAMFPAALFAKAQAAKLSPIHGSYYRGPEPYAGKRVLVVGSGNTGGDIATEVSRVAKQTLFSARTTPWLVPEYIFRNTRWEEPADLFAQRRVPDFFYSLEMLAFRAIQKFAVGHPTRDLGLPAPIEHDILDRLPTVDRGLAEALLEGRVLPRRGLVDFYGRRPVFHRGNREEPIDAVIFATGYHHGNFPFLPQELKEGAKEPALWVFDRKEEDLLYLYEVGVAQGVWPIFVDQAKAATAYLKAQTAGTANYELFREARTQTNPDFKGRRFRLAEPRFLDARRYSDYLHGFRFWIQE
ncbi:NAD(P)-binding domain-containing protein [bacterium]|nr:NAD(P)-binding domain-containing protein [bacterium]